MSLARLVVTAIRIQGRSKRVVARDYRVSRRWVPELAAGWPLPAQENDRNPAMWIGAHDYRAADTIHAARAETIPTRRGPERMGPER